MLHYLEKNHLLHQPATLCFAHEDSDVILVLQCIVKVCLNVLIIHGTSVSAVFTKGHFAPIA